MTVFPDASISSGLPWTTASTALGSPSATTAPFSA